MELWQAESDLVAVPRGLLNEILADGTCPLHLRVQLQQMTQQHAVKQAQPEVKKEHVEEASAEKSLGGGEEEERQDELEDTCPMGRVAGPCLTLVATHLPLAEVLAVRATSTGGLEWAMQRSVRTLGELQQVHDRIRTRLWIERVADLTKETADETVFETKVRSLANDVLRRRMEAEMAETKLHMERQIHAFQGEVDRRMEEQATRVHAIVEERVQQQLDATLAAEMERVRATVEERVQDRVRAVVQREVCATVCEVQARLAALARENDRLRDAFVDHSDLCFRSLVWALSPNATGIFARTLRTVWYCRRRARRLSAWVFGIPLERKRERLRLRLEAACQASGDDPHALWGPEVLGQDPGPQLAGLLSAAAAAGVLGGRADAPDVAAPVVTEVHEDTNGGNAPTEDQAVPTQDLDEAELAAPGREALVEGHSEAGDEAVTEAGTEAPPGTEAPSGAEAPLGEERQLSHDHPAALSEEANTPQCEGGETLRRGDDCENVEDLEDSDMESNSPPRLVEPSSEEEEDDADEDEGVFEEKGAQDEQEDSAAESEDEMVEEPSHEETQDRSNTPPKSTNLCQDHLEEGRARDWGMSADSDIQQTSEEAVPRDAHDDDVEDKYEDAEEGDEPFVQEVFDRTERRSEQHDGDDSEDMYVDAEEGPEADEHTSQFEERHPDEPDAPVTSGASFSA